MIDISNLVGLYLKTNISIVKNKYKLYLKISCHTNFFNLGHTITRIVQIKLKKEKNNN